MVVVAVLGAIAAAAGADDGPLVVVAQGLLATGATPELKAGALQRPSRDYTGSTTTLTRRAASAASWRASSTVSA